MSHLEPQPAQSYVESVLSFKAPTPAQPRFDVTVERAPVGIAHFDESGRFLYVNPQLCAMFGLTREALLGKTFQEISFADDLPRCLELTQQLASGKIPRYSIAKRFTRPDGSLAYTRVIVTAVRGAGAESSYFIGVVEDIKEQWEHERAREQAEERLRLALDASAMGIYRFDFATQALEWSYGCARLAGLPDSEELISLQRSMSLVHPEDLSRMLAAIERSERDGDDIDLELRVILQDGTIRWLHDRARLMRDESGKANLTGVVTDITKRREAEAARDALFERERAARSDAEKAMQLRDEVLAVVAHDLRNPLYAILMSVKAALELPLSPEDQARQLTLIQNSARAIDALIRDLLDATQIDMGRLAMSASPTSVEMLVDESVTSVAQLALERGLRLETDVPPGLPPVVADRRRIVQVLGNLLGNALKFTPRPGRIVVRARHDGAFVEIAIVDTGRGIAPEHLSRVFERYWQADRTARVGVGLGLAIVRGIVQAHGGSITVDSRLDQGSTFRFTLPAAD